MCYNNSVRFNLKGVMTMQIPECILTDLFDCGTADLCMLDDLYGKLGDDIYYGDTGEMLKKHVGIEGDGLNGVLSEFYYDITIAVADCMENLIEDFRENGDISDLHSMLEEILTEKGKKATKRNMNKAIEVMEKSIDNLRVSYPFANCLDTHFQNDLDQTIDFDDTVLGNTRTLIEWIIE